MSYGQPYNGYPGPGQYPPPNQQWGPPPPQQQGYSPQPPHGNPYPPPQQGFAQAGAYGHHQHHQPQGYQQPYGAPPGPYGPPQGQFGGPPPQQYGGPPPQQYQRPGPPTLGYDVNQVAQVDTTRDAEALRGAMKGLGTDEARLIQVLANIPDPLVMANLRRTYDQRFSRNLFADVSKETSGYFKEGLEAIIRGPLHQDAHNLRDALEGAGTKEHVLDDVLLGRSNADMNAIKGEYHRLYHRSLHNDVRGDLSLKTAQLFDMVLSATRNDESAPVIPQEVDRAVADLHHATAGRPGTDQTTVCQIFSHHSDGQLRAIAHAYNAKYHTPLSHVIHKEFSGHMQSSLLRMLGVAEDRAKADADSLEAAMKGAGTKDRLLLNRMVRYHWNRQRWQQVRAAYRHFHRRDLRERVHGETSHDFRKLLVALCELP